MTIALSLRRHLCTLAAIALSCLIAWLSPKSAHGTSLQPASEQQSGSPDALPPIPVPNDYRPNYLVCSLNEQGSTYVPIDSWVYPALDRLHALGYLDTAFLGLRPWTRSSIAAMIENTQYAVLAGSGPAADEGQGILLAVQRELTPSADAPSRHAELDTVYSRFLGVTDTPLRDSYHLGQTIINDYGRPYQAGLNNVTGFSGRAEAARLALYVRGEYQQAPSASGYSSGLFAYLSNTVDLIPTNTNLLQSTIPLGPINDTSIFRILEANASVHLWGHEVSFGKSDHWMSPAKGGAFAWSNNAENIYAFQIDRVAPLTIPLLSRAIGLARYDFFVGSLKGHTFPNDPWVHAEKISFKPTVNLELGFERTVIWGGKDHVPITLNSFLRSFFSVQDVSGSEKTSRKDPGARFGSFDFSYRVPFFRSWLTIYTDSLVHDDVSPVSAPRRAGVRPGLYLSHFPGAPHLDMRVEAASTDPPTSRSTGGLFLQWESIQRQGPTNKGFLFGDAIGREDKGGQAWLTWHLSPNEQIQLSYRDVKAAKDFIAFGTTQNQYKLDVVKRLSKDLELHAWFQHERWVAPVYRSGNNTDDAIAGQLTWYPRKQHRF